MAVSIPALIVPTLNQPDRLDAMLSSIDYPVDQVIIIDNGDQHFGDWIEDTFSVVHLPHNLGVAASWNLGIKLTPFAGWRLIVNDDITFGPGDLERVATTIDPARAALHFLLGMAAFALTDATIDAIGMFDESIVNAYNEDLDYGRRADLAGLPRIELGFTGTHAGSATIMADPVLRSWNGLSHGENDRYYAEKWGGRKQGGETYSLPFNQGTLADWRLDFRRYRAQTWPRPKS